MFLYAISTVVFAAMVATGDFLRRLATGLKSVAMKTTKTARNETTAWKNRLVILDIDRCRLYYQDGKAVTIKLLWKRIDDMEKLEEYLTEMANTCGYKKRLLSPEEFLDAEYNEIEIIE